MAKPRITRKKFEEQYARRSGMTVTQLEEGGLFSVPCDCDYKGCWGWQMATPRIENQWALIADDVAKQRAERAGQVSPLGPMFILEPPPKKMG